MIFTEFDFCSVYLFLDCYVLQSDFNPVNRLVIDYYVLRAVINFLPFRSFSREISTNKLGLTTGQRILALEIVNKIAYASFEAQYSSLYEQLLTSATASVIEYYQANWHEIRHEWVLGLKLGSGSFMNTTNN